MIWEAAARGLWADVASSEGTKPVTFKGYDQAFPEPMVMVSFNCAIPNLGKRENARVRFGDTKRAARKTTQRARHADAPSAQQFLF